MIKVTVDGEALWLNPHRLVSVRTLAGGTKVATAEDAWFVAETPEQVVALMAEWREGPFALLESNLDTFAPSLDPVVVVDDEVLAGIVQDGVSTVPDPVAPARAWPEGLTPAQAAAFLAGWIEGQVHGRVVMTDEVVVDDPLAEIAASVSVLWGGTPAHVVDVTHGVLTRVAGRLEA